MSRAKSGRLPAAALGLILALSLAHYALPLSALPWCALGAAALFALCLALRRRGMALVLALAAAGFVWYWGYDAVFVARAELCAGEEVPVTARVTEYSREYGDYSSVYVRLTTPGLPEAKCLLYDYGGSMADLRPGDEIASKVKLKAATVRYGEETDAYTSKGVLLRGYFKAPVEVTGRWRFAFLYAPKTAALAVAEMVSELFPPDVAPFLRAMLIGDKLDIYDDDAAYLALTRAGIFHICAVSGMHLAFVYAFLTLLVGRRRAAWVTVPALWLFALMAGATPSVIRSAFMLTMVVAAPLFDREADSLASLSAVTILLLLINPMAIGSASLQLSFGATAGIVLCSPRVYRWCDERWKEDKKRRGTMGSKARRAVIASLASSVGAIVFTTPLAALRFGYVPLLSPIANMATLWAMSICFIGGYFCVLLGFIWTPLGVGAAWCLSWLARYVLLAARLISAVPLSVVYMKDSLVGAWLCFTYAAFIFAWRRRGKAPFRPVAPTAVSVITLCAVVLSSALYYRQGARVLAVDVGQGACAAFMSGGDTVVVDCGGMELPQNAGDEAAQYLLSRGRGDVDALILTHLHEDHANGAKRLISMVRVRRLFLPRSAPDSDDMLEGILEAASRRGTEVYYIGSDTVLSMDALTVTLYAPMGAGDENERGLMALVSMDGYDALITGDADSAAERRIAEEKSLPDCEMLFVGHHGSKYSTSQALLSAITPETAIISVGYNNYGHPTQEALTRLAMNGVTVYRTDTDGTISIRIKD